MKAGARIALGAVAAALALAAASAAGSAPPVRRVIEVHPGPHAIATAIAAASAGDTLRIHPGTYPGSLVVDKPLTLEGAGSRRTVIDAGCHANDAIDVKSAGVTIDGVTVEGAATGFADSPAEVLFEGVSSGAVTNVRAIDSCDAHYGLSVFTTGPVRVAHDYARGFEDSGIYIGSIADTLGKTLVVKDNKTVHNARGIIVEDSNLPAAHIAIVGNTMSHNTIPIFEGPSDGLFFTATDHVLIAHNTANKNGGSGFEPDSTSNDNVFRHNDARDNARGALRNKGHGNCGGGNSFPIAHC